MLKAKGWNVLSGLIWGYIPRIEDSNRYLRADIIWYLRGIFV